MPDLPQLATTIHCPDEQCAVPIGTEHLAECEVAICLDTGQQRILHQADMLEPPILNLATHTCGEDVWTGQHHGVAECREYDWYVRKAEDADAPLTGWIPCPATDPRAVPDLDRLARHATWSPADTMWRRQQEVTGRG